MKITRSVAVSVMPFCRHSAVLGIEKGVFWGLREYTKVIRIIQGIFFDWLGDFEVKEWCARLESNQRPTA